jgi:nucleotide-binding universal stress UspA family protein
LAGDPGEWRAAEQTDGADEAEPRGDLTPAEVGWRPLPEANSIGLIVRHLAIEADWHRAAIERAEPIPFDLTEEQQRQIDLVPFDFDANLRASRAGRPANNRTKLTSGVPSCRLRARCPPPHLCDGVDDERKVPTDFSPAARRAFPLAALLARSFGAEVIALHAVPERTLATLSGIPGPLPPALSEAALWEHFQRDFAGVTVTAQVHEGSPWRRIVHTVQVEKADLVVVSTLGRDSLGDRIVGSTTERVVRHAPCPVLVA